MSRKVDQADGRVSPFERIKRTNAAQNEYWESRDLAEALEYTQYRNFEAVIAKAKLACFNSGHRIEDHFADVSKMMSLGCNELPTGEAGNPYWTGMIEYEPADEKYISFSSRLLIGGNMLQLPKGA